MAVVGAGQLGLELGRADLPDGWWLDVLDRSRAELSDEPSLRTALAELRPDAVVNAAAHTSVDDAERHPAQAWQANALGPALLASICAERAIRLVQVSTDYVFDGTACSPYPPDAALCPIGVYGASKAAGELAVLQALRQSLIVRTSWLFSPFRDNFVRTVFGLLPARESLRVVDDQHGTPTAARDLAGAILRLLDQGATGVFHVAGSGCTTWYELSCTIQTQAIALLGDAWPGARCTIVPVSTAEYGSLARRPAYSVLDTRGLEDLGITLPAWQSALHHCLKEILEP